MAKNFAFVLGTGVASIAATASAIYIYKYFKNKNIDLNTERKEECQKRILVLGLDGSGKTSLLHNLNVKLDEGPFLSRPTDGFNVVCIETDDDTINIWEVGGSTKNRAYWPQFIETKEYTIVCLVYVVDSNDVGRLKESKTELIKILNDKKLNDVSLIICANKQDLPNTKSSKEIIDFFGMSNSYDRKVYGIDTAVPYEHNVRKGIDDLRAKLNHCMKS